VLERSRLVDKPGIEVYRPHILIEKQYGRCSFSFVDGDTIGHASVSTELREQFVEYQVLEAGLAPARTEKS
jgi:hypothetical protein